MIPSDAPQPWPTFPGGGGVLGPTGGDPVVNLAIIAEVDQESGMVAYEVCRFPATWDQGRTMLVAQAKVFEPKYRPIFTKVRSIYRVNQDTVWVMLGTIGHTGRYTLRLVEWLDDIAER
ncbi:MAG: hypothetical protein WAV45_15350 [Propionibacteriaceae bacterium]|nr:hypothetical protein [Micropruina sp.]HBX81325.1 hypothetical protein [Propionibacteriaceae bacterium]HBY22428.1 hypothetical protein [Propionibacteriaceae bacterium]